MLPETLVTDWRSRHRLPSCRPSASREVRLRGPEGLRDYGQHVRVTVPDPQEFDALMHTGRLGGIGTFCSLHTPIHVERTEELIREWPADVVVIGVHRLTTGVMVTQGNRNYTYRRGQLVFASNASPYVQQSHGISDPAGLVIPTELLGREGRIAVDAKRPVAPDTILSRATAAFVRRVAFDVARGEVDPAAEETAAAAVELIRAALGQLNYLKHRIDDNPVFLRQAAQDLIDRRHRDPDFGVAAIAQSLHLSRRQLYRHFQSEDRSLAQLIADRRVATATRLLTSQPDLGMAEIAYSAGFTSATTMRNHFRAAFALTPTEYRVEAAAGRLPRARD